MTETRYTQIPQHAIETLSVRAIGMLAIFITQGENANLTKIMEEQSDGARVIRGGMRELEARGYLTRTYKKEGREFRGTVWKINLHPEIAQDDSEAA